MNDWQNKAILLLHKSLGTVPTELNELDWKSGLSNKSERLAQHLSAFANYPGGGILVFGVNSDATLAAISKAEGDEIIQRLGNIARNNLSPPVSIEHTYQSFKGSELLFIHIPESGELPVHIRSSDLFDSYTRSAGQTVRMSHNEVKELIARSRGFSFDEEQVAMRQATVDEVLSLLDYESYFKLIDKKIPADRTKIVEVLENEELVKKNQDLWDITNLGAILFAKEITQFNTLKRKAVRLVVYKSSGRTEAIKERDGHYGYAASFERLIQYIMDREDRVRACFQHCVLNLVNNQQTNNQSVRKRFNISEKNYPMASRIIAETIEAGLIKLADPDSNSKKYASYIPFWA